MATADAIKNHGHVLYRIAAAAPLSAAQVTDTS